MLFRSACIWAPTVDRTGILAGMYDRRTYAASDEIIQIGKPGVDAMDRVLQLTGGVLGTDVVTEDFATDVTVTPSEPQCRALTINLGPITVDALVASVDVPAASVEADASGAVGTLLCQLTGLLASGAPTAQVQQVVTAINAAL